MSTDGDRGVSHGWGTGWPHAAVLAAAFAALLACTWGRWPDPLVDFGRELYVPWQMAEGQRLFDDLAWFNGPLSPGWNALMFRVFDVGFATLVWANAALFAALIALLHAVLRRISSPFAATCACLSVLTVLGFGQLVGTGNYNFICPYSHEATHGLLLGVAALAALQCGRGTRGWTGVAGACVGLAFLTKPEMFVAALAGAGTVVLLRVWCAGRDAARAAGWFVLGVFVPIGASWAWLSLSLPGDTAWRGTLGAWPSLLSSDVLNLPFYRTRMGLDAPVANLLAMLGWAAGIALLLLPSAALAARGRRPAVDAALAFVLTAVAVAGLWTTVHVPVLRAARAWPLVALAAAVVSVALACRERGDDRRVAAAGFAVFALAALGKMALQARLSHYGFALALPATALVAVGLLDTLPRAFARHNGSGRTFRAGALAALLGMTTVALLITASFHLQKRQTVGTGADAFRTDARGRIINAALAWLGHHYPPGSRRPTLAVVPEGAMLNYLARLANPTPYTNLMPPEMLFFGEATITDTFRMHPPDVVIIAHKDTHEYGATYFGREYGRQLGAWIAANYESAALFGDPPLQPGSAFGLAILTRKPRR